MAEVWIVAGHALEVEILKYKTYLSFLCIKPFRGSPLPQNNVLFLWPQWGPPRAANPSSVTPHCSYLPLLCQKHQMTCRPVLSTLFSPGLCSYGPSASIPSLFLHILQHLLRCSAFRSLSYTPGPLAPLMATGAFLSFPATILY